MKFQTLIIGVSMVFFNAPTIAQEQGNLNFLKKTEVFAGTKIRVTPIPLKLVPNDATYYFQITPIDNVDSHLSGFGSFFIDEKVTLSKSISLVFHQSIRKDFLVEHFELGPNYPYKSLGVEKRFFYDLYAHILYNIRKEKTGKLYLTGGVGYSGFNSKHSVTIRTYSSATNYTDSIFPRSFLYPTASLGIRWDRKRIGAGLIFGFFLKRPDLYISMNKNQKITIPEINFHYKLFRNKEEN